MALRTLGSYIRKGINVGIGTDTYPHNMLEELRMAAYAARIAGESVDDVTTSEVFHAATVGGARALLRDDIGRLAPGCRADIVLVDLKQRSMMPVREPLRSLIYCGAERAVRDVFVDGEQVVVEGHLAHIDLDSALAEVEAIQGARDPRTSKIGIGRAGTFMPWHPWPYRSMTESTARAGGRRFDGLAGIVQIARRSSVF